MHPEWERNAIATVTAVAPAFSWISGKVAEWRVGRDGPEALILRIAVASKRERPKQAATRLLVLKIDRGGAAATCLVGAVNGRAGGNEAARAMADQAQRLPCLR